MSSKLNESVLDRLFRTARTRNAWTDRPATEQQLRELYEIASGSNAEGSSACCWLLLLHLPDSIWRSVSKSSCQDQRLMPDLTDTRGEGIA